MLAAKKVEDGISLCSACALSVLLGDSSLEAALVTCRCRHASPATPALRSLPLAIETLPSPLCPDSPDADAATTPQSPWPWLWSRSPASSNDDEEFFTARASLSTSPDFVRSSAPSPSVPTGIDTHQAHHSRPPGPSSHELPTADDISPLTPGGSPKSRASTPLTSRAGLFEDQEGSMGRAAEHPGPQGRLSLPPTIDMPAPGLGFVSSSFWAKLEAPIGGTGSTGHLGFKGLSGGDESKSAGPRWPGQVPPSRASPIASADKEATPPSEAVSLSLYSTYGGPGVWGSPSVPGAATGITAAGHLFEGGPYCSSRTTPLTATPSYPLSPVAVTADDLLAVRLRPWGSAPGSVLIEALSTGGGSAAVDLGGGAPDLDPTETRSGLGGMSGSDDLGGGWALPEVSAGMGGCGVACQLDAAAPAGPAGASAAEATLLNTGLWVPRTLEEARLQLWVLQAEVLALQERAQQAEAGRVEAERRLEEAMRERAPQQVQHGGPESAEPGHPNPQQLADGPVHSRITSSITVPSVVSVPSLRHDSYRKKVVGSVATAATSPSASGHSSAVRSAVHTHCTSCLFGPGSGTPVSGSKPPGLVTMPIRAAELETVTFADDAAANALTFSCSTTPSSPIAQTGQEVIICAATGSSVAAGAIQPGHGTQRGPGKESSGGRAMIRTAKWRMATERHGLGRQGSGEAAKEGSSHSAAATASAASAAARAAESGMGRRVVRGTTAC